jgi:hypothetical protein
MIKRLLLIAFLMFACVAPAAFAPAAFAQTQTATPAAKPLPPGFERVAGAPETDKVDANKLVIIAYIVFFVAMFGYIVYIARGQAAIAKEMAELNERIRRAEKK